jgi:hypothetical protein
MQMLLDGESPTSDRRNEIIEGMGSERLDNSLDNDGEMMDVEFDRNDPSAGLDQGYGANPESVIDVIGRFAIKTEPTEDVSEGGHLPRTDDGVPTEASGNHAMPRVTADANEKNAANVYTVQHTHEVQSGTMYRDQRTNP